MELLSKQLEEERPKNNGGNPRSPLPTVQQSTQPASRTKERLAALEFETPNGDKEPWSKVGPGKHPRTSNPVRPATCTSTSTSFSTSQYQEPLRMEALPPPSGKKAKRVTATGQGGPFQAASNEVRSARPPTPRRNFRNTL